MELDRRFAEVSARVSSLAKTVVVELADALDNAFDEERVTGLITQLERLDKLTGDRSVSPVSEDQAAQLEDLEIQYASVAAQAEDLARAIDTTSLELGAAGYLDASVDLYNLGQELRSAAAAFQDGRTDAETFGSELTRVTDAADDTVTALGEIDGVDLSGIVARIGGLIGALVHLVRSRGREYFYYQAGRGTAHAGERIKLPSDPRTPEFWNAVRQAQGLTGPTPSDTINALVDAFEAAWPTLQRKITEGTQDQYRRHLKYVRNAWGDLPARDLRPKHVQALIQKIGAEKPGTANNVLSALKAMTKWANGPVELLAHDPTTGVMSFPKGQGHQPWTEEQLAHAEQHFTGMMRRFFFLSRYTGQRISDIVRLSPTHVDEGGFSLAQKKTGVRPWCPIFPELEAEMAKWERRPGPYLLQEKGKSIGKPFSTNQMWKDFDAERKKHPILKGAVPHGLRANAVIRLRREGHTALQISDMVGMSVEMVEHYSRHADRKASGQGILRTIHEREDAPIVKRLENGKQK